MKMLLTALLAAVAVFAMATLLTPHAHAQLPPSAECAVQCLDNFLNCELECHLFRWEDPYSYPFPELDPEVRACVMECQNTLFACQNNCGT